MGTEISHVECIKCKNLLGYCRETSGAISVQPCACQNPPQYLKPYKPPQPVEEPITTCWYKVDGEWKCGFFHQWSMDHAEFETGPGNIPVAVIEDAKDCRVHVIYAGDVSFNPDDPDEADDPAPEPNESLVEAAEAYKSIKFDNRFIPQMRKLPCGWAIRVDPDTIEIFDVMYRHVCQVKWEDGRMEAPHGGLPREELKQIFEEDK